MKSVFVIFVVLVLTNAALAGIDPEPSIVPAPQQWHGGNGNLDNISGQGIVNGTNAYGASFGTNCIVHGKSDCIRRQFFDAASVKCHAGNSIPHYFEAVWCKVYIFRSQRASALRKPVEKVVSNCCLACGDNSPASPSSTTSLRQKAK